MQVLYSISSKNSSISSFCFLFHNDQLRFLFFYSARYLLKNPSQNTFEHHFALMFTSQTDINSFIFILSLRSPLIETLPPKRRLIDTPKFGWRHNVYRSILFLSIRKSILCILQLTTIASVIIFCAWQR
jgi:hypothetical protein